MKRLGLFICVFVTLCVLFAFFSTCKAGTVDELYAIAEKYMENPMVMENHGDHVCAYILNKEKTEVVAVDVRTLDLKVCMYFFEKVDGVMKLVWTNPIIEENKRKFKEKNQV